MVTLTLAFTLFWAAFLAATVLPFSSEAALSGALVAGLPWGWALLAATLGNSAGSMSTWYLGRLGRLDWLKKYCHVTEEQIQNARKRIGRFGAAGAFLCFLPVVGDVFAIALGFMRYPAGKFLVFMTAGKICRYALWIWIHLFIKEAV